jgi:hypothetical protein
VAAPAGRTGGTSLVPPAVVVAGVIALLGLLLVLLLVA